MTEGLPNGPVLQSAGVWRRLMGMVYEGIILFGVLFFFGYGFSALLRFQGQPGMLRDLFQWFLTIVLGFYFTWFWSMGRRSLPMKTVSLLIVDRYGSPISTLRAMTRFLVVGVLGLLPLALSAKFHPILALLALLPLGWCFFDSDRQALHDRLCGTRLVVSDPKDPGQSFTQSTK